MTSDLFLKIKSGCLHHDPINWDCNLCMELAFAHLCDAINELNMKWEERQNEIIKTNRAAFEKELGIIRGPDVEEDRFIDLGPLGVIEGRVDASSDRGDREPGQREDSVGRRRRRQIFDGSGILHEEGSSE